jgi:hypothetical protein
MAICVRTHIAPRLDFRAKPGVDDGSVVAAHKAEPDVMSTAFRLLKPRMNCQIPSARSESVLLKLIREILDPTSGLYKSRHG